jgi:hypothetical protein
VFSQESDVFFGWAEEQKQHQAAYARDPAWCSRFQLDAGKKSNISPQKSGPSLARFV